MSKHFMMDSNMKHVEVILNFLEKYDKSNAEYVLNGDGIDIADVAIIARKDFSSQNIVVKISEDVRRNLDDNTAYLKNCLDKKMVIYGVNTGFGGSADVRNEDILAMQKSLIFHLNCGSLDKRLDVGHVRSAMFVRANSLSRAYSGVRPQVIDLLCEMINNDIVPQVPMRGSVSSSGDLLHLSYLSACMSGDKRKELVYHKGKLSGTAEDVFKSCGVQFVEFQAKEALAVTNSAGCASTLAAINLFDFGSCLLLTEIITALSVECLKGRMETFHKTVCDGLPHQGMREFSGVLNKLLVGSKLARHDPDKQLIDGQELAQDRYALRTSPQWMSPPIETYSESLKKITIELNSSNDNPLIDHREQTIIHCGNFQGISITVAMDQTRQSIQMCGRMIFAQLSEILNFHMSSGLPPNLSGCDYSKDFGFKGIDTALAAYTSELEFLAGPMTNHVMSAEMHNQSINSMAMVSARKTAETLDLLRLIMASSLLSLCQAVDLRWLEGQVNKAWEEVIEEMSTLKIMTCNSSWYDAAFRFEFVESQLGNCSFKPVDEKDLNEIKKKFAELVLRFKIKVKNLVDTINNGSHIEHVTNMLGAGTSKIYKYIRKDLDVHFHDGSATLDISLEKILQSITSRRINEKLIDIFNF